MIWLRTRIEARKIKYKRIGFKKVRPRKCVWAKRLKTVWGIRKDYKKAIGNLQPPLKLRGYVMRCKLTLRTWPSSSKSQFPCPVPKRKPQLSTTAT